MSLEGAQKLGAAFQSARGDGDALAKYFIENGLVRNHGLFDDIVGDEPCEELWKDPDTQQRLLDSFRKRHPGLFESHGGVEGARDFLEKLITNAAGLAWLKYGDW